VSLESVAFAACVGTFIGVVAGYVGGLVDEALSRLMDLLFSVPSYLLGIVVIVTLGGGLTHAALAIGVVFTPQFGRIARSGTIEVRARAYVESARLSGRGSAWIVFRHIVPNIMTPLSIMIGVTLANAEGAYAVLSYLGFGATPPTPDYGSMLSESQQYMTSDPWLVFFPAAALVLLIFGFILLGDWIRERGDPNSKVWVGGTALAEAVDSR
jgi:ABC-type dipeptide/oligopeptide/nickel transport system permease subunit